MIKREDWDGLTVPELKEEVAVRWKLLPKLVSNLFPQILLDEIADINKLIVQKSL